MRELVGSGPAMCALEEATFIAEHFARAEIRPPPCGGVGRAAVEAAPANSVTKLCSGIVSMDDGIIVLARQRV